MTKLTKQEEELLDSVERGEWHSVRNKRGEVSRYSEVAKATFRKDRRVNIRLSQRDLEGIKKRALEEGIPYQTLMASVIHKYVAGRLTEANSQKTS